MYTSVFLIDKIFVGEDNSGILYPSTLYAEDSLVVAVNDQTDWTIDQSDLSTEDPVTKIVLFSSDIDKINKLIETFGQDLLSESLKVYYFGDQDSVIDLQSLLINNVNYGANATLYYLGADKIAASPIPSNINIDTSFTFQLNQAWPKDAASPRDTNSGEAKEISSLLAITTNPDTTGLAPFSTPANPPYRIDISLGEDFIKINGKSRDITNPEQELQNLLNQYAVTTDGIARVINISLELNQLEVGLTDQEDVNNFYRPLSFRGGHIYTVTGGLLSGQQTIIQQLDGALKTGIAYIGDAQVTFDNIHFQGGFAKGQDGGFSAGGGLGAGGALFLGQGAAVFINDTHFSENQAEGGLGGAGGASGGVLGKKAAVKGGKGGGLNGQTNSTGILGTFGFGGNGGTGGKPGYSDGYAQDDPTSGTSGGAGGFGGGGGGGGGAGTDYDKGSDGETAFGGRGGAAGPLAESGGVGARSRPDQRTSPVSGAGGDGAGLGGAIFVYASDEDITGKYPNNAYIHLGERVTFSDNSVSANEAESSGEDIFFYGNVDPAGFVSFASDTASQNFDARYFQISTGLLELDSANRPLARTVTVDPEGFQENTTSSAPFTVEEGVDILELVLQAPYTPIDAPVGYELWLDKDQDQIRDQGEVTRRLEILRSVNAEGGIVQSTIDLKEFFKNDRQFTGDYTAHFSLFVPEFLTLKVANNTQNIDLSSIEFLVKERNANLLFDWEDNLELGVAVPFRLSEASLPANPAAPSQKEFTFAFFQGDSQDPDALYTPENITLYFRTSIQNDGSWHAGDYLSIGQISQNKLSASAANPAGAAPSEIFYDEVSKLYSISNFSKSTELTLSAPTSDAKYAYNNLQFSIVDPQAIEEAREYKSDVFAFSLIVEGLGEQAVNPAIQLNDDYKYYAVTIKLVGSVPTGLAGSRFFAKVSQARSSIQHDSDTEIENAGLRIASSTETEVSGDLRAYLDLGLTWNDETEAWDNRLSPSQVELNASNDYSNTIYIQSRGNNLSDSAVREAISVGLYKGVTLGEGLERYIDASSSTQITFDVGPDTQPTSDNGYVTLGTKITIDSGSREVEVANLSPYQNTVELILDEEYDPQTRIILPEPASGPLYEGESAPLQIFFTLDEPDLVTISNAIQENKTIGDVFVTIKLLIVEDNTDTPVQDVIVIRNDQRIDQLSLTLRELVDSNKNNGTGEIQGLSLRALRDQRLEQDQKPYSLVASFDTTQNQAIRDLLPEINIADETFEFKVSDERPATGAFIAEVTELLLSQNEEKINTQLSRITGLPGIDSIGSAINSKLWSFQDELYKNLEQLDPSEASSTIEATWGDFNVDYTFKNAGFSQGILELNLGFNILGTDFNIGIGLNDNLSLNGQGDIDLGVKAQFIIAYGLSDQAPALIQKENETTFNTFEKPSDFPNLKELNLPGVKQITNKLSTFFIDTAKTKLNIFAGVDAQGGIEALLGPVTATLGIKEETKVGASFTASLEDYDYGRYVKVQANNGVINEASVKHSSSTYGIGTLDEPLEPNERALFLTREKVDPIQVLLETLFGKQNNFPKQSVRVYNDGEKVVGISTLNYLEPEFSETFKTYIPGYATTLDFDSADVFEFIDTSKNDLFDDGEKNRFGQNLVDDDNFNDSVDGFTRLYRYQPKAGFIFYDENDNKRVDGNEHLAILDDQGSFNFSPSFKSKILELDANSNTKELARIYTFREDGDRAYLGEIFSSTQDQANDFSFAKFIKDQFRAKATAEATLVASLDADLERLAGGLPGISAGLNLGYTGLAYEYDPQKGGLVRKKEDEGFTAELKDITLDLGSFLSDLVEPTINLIYEYLSPFKPLVDTLGQEVEILETLGLTETFDRNSNGTATVLELAATIATIISPKSAPKIQRSLESFDRLTGYLKQLYDIYDGFQALDSGPDSGGLEINLGSLIYDGSDDDQSVDEPDKVSLKTRQQVLNAIPDSTPDSVQSKTFDLAKKVLKSNLQLPVFSLAGIKDIIEGEDTVLAALDLPRFELDFYVAKTFNIWGPLSGKLFGELALALDVDFGFDTSGINEYIRTVENLAVSPTDSPKVLAEKQVALLKAGLLPLDGFYVSDFVNADGTGDERPEIALSATVGVGAGLDLGILSGYVTGGITGNANLDLVDLGEYNGRNDGRVHFSEIVTLLDAGASPFRLFGGVDLFVGIEISTFAATVYEANLASVPLVRFDTGIPRAAQLSSGTATDGRMSGVPVYFDANYNSFYDPYEPYVITNPDGSYELNISLLDFDVDLDGLITSRDGQLIFAGSRLVGEALPQGVDISTGTLVDVPLLSLPDWQTATAASSIFSFIESPDYLALSRDFLEITGQLTSEQSAGITENLIDFNPASESSARSSYYYALKLLLLSIASNIDHALAPQNIPLVAGSYVFSSPSLEGIAENFTGQLLVSLRNQFGEELPLTTTDYELPQVLISAADLQNSASSLPEYLILEWQFEGFNADSDFKQSGEIPVFVDFSNPESPVLEIRPRLQDIYNLAIEVYAQQLVEAKTTDGSFDLLTDKAAARNIQDTIASLLLQQGVIFSWDSLDPNQANLNVVFEQVDSIRSQPPSDITGSYLESLQQLGSSNASVGGLLDTSKANLYHQLLAYMDRGDASADDVDPVTAYLLLGYDVAIDTTEGFVDPKIYNSIEALFAKRQDINYSLDENDPDFLNYKLDVLLNTVVKVVATSVALTRDEQPTFSDFLAVYETLADLVRERFDQTVEANPALDSDADVKVGDEDYKETFAGQKLDLKSRDFYQQLISLQNLSVLQDEAFFNQLPSLLVDLATTFASTDTLMNVVISQKVFQQILVLDLENLYSATDNSWFTAFDATFEAAFTKLEKDPSIADPISKPSLLPAPQLRPDSLVLAKGALGFAITPLENDTFFGYDPTGAVVRSLTLEGIELLDGLEILPMAADGSIDLDMLVKQDQLTLLNSTLFTIVDNTITFKQDILDELTQPLSLLYSVRDQEERTYKGMLTLFKEGQNVTGYVENYRYRGFEDSNGYDYFEILSSEIPDPTKYESLFGELLIDTTTFSADQQLGLTASKYQSSEASFSNIVAFYRALDEYGSVLNPYYKENDSNDDSPYLSDEDFLGLSSGDFDIDQPDLYPIRTTIDVTKKVLLPFDYGYTTAALVQTIQDGLFLQTGRLISELPQRDTVTGSTISGDAYYLPILLANVGSLVTSLKSDSTDVTFDSIIGEYINLYGKNPGANINEYRNTPLAYSASPIANPDFHQDANGEILAGGDGLHFSSQSDSDGRYVYGFEDLPGAMPSGTITSDRDYDDGRFELEFLLLGPPEN